MMTPRIKTSDHVAMMCPSVASASDFLRTDRVCSHHASQHPIECKAGLTLPVMSNLPSSVLSSTAMLLEPGCGLNMGMSAVG